MFVIRFLFRLAVFLVGLAAMSMIVYAGFFFLQRDSGEAITLAEAQPVVMESPQTIEDFALCFMLQSRADEINNPLSDDARELAFTVAPGATALSVAEELQTAGLVADAQLFRRFLRCNGLDASLEAGDYTLRRNMNMREIGEALQKARFEEVTITIPEGLRAEEIAELLDDENIMSGTAFLNFVREGSGLDHELLTSKPGDKSYEGYLFPDTYRLPARAEPADLLERMLDNMAARVPDNASALAAQQGLSLYEILIVASIVEREAVIAEERPIIASVYLNRIAQDMYLQADPTVQYAMGYQPDRDQWWKTPVTLEEYSTVDSPYNTYLTPGLPPTPIANAGIEAILATLQPADTDYLFFVAFENGAHVFAETFEEHEQNVAAYQGR